jgi:hypothetical protein
MHRGSKTFPREEDLRGSRLIAYQFRSPTREAEDFASHDLGRGGQHEEALSRAHDFPLFFERNKPVAYIPALICGNFQLLADGHRVQRLNSRACKEFEDIFFDFHEVRTRFECSAVWAIFRVDIDDPHPVA